ncbi:MAG: SMC-Scp complex subunit ScpB [Candidatus Binataceae bacterium]
MEEERLKSILESLLFAAGEPLSIARIAAVLEGVQKAEIQHAFATLGAEYSANSRGLAIEEVAGGYQLRTPKEHAQYVRRLLAARPPRLSRPLLETVAIIAYRQPITRPEIEQLRGVDTGGVLETLLERRLIKIAGRKEAPGRPMMYATTPEFLEVFSLKDLESLPDLKEFQEIERAVEQTEIGPVESIETHPEDAASATGESPAIESSANETVGDADAPPSEAEPEKSGSREE